MATTDADWVGEVLTHHDIGEVIMNALDRMQDVRAYGLLCKATCTHAKPILAVGAEIANHGHCTGSATAARTGNLRMVRWLCETDPGAGSNTYRAGPMAAAAARMGHFHILEYLKDIGGRFDAYTCASAGAGGRLDVLEWLDSVTKIGGKGMKLQDGFQITDGAARAKDPACLKYVLAKGCRANDHTMTNAAMYGCVENLELLKAAGVKPGAINAHAAGAAISGRIEHLRWLHENGAPMTTEAASGAAEKGRPECLRYAFTHSGLDSWSLRQDLLKQTCKSTSWECVEFLLSADAYVDEEIVNEAVKHANTDFIDRFVAMGHKPRPKAYELALRIEGNTTAANVAETWKRDLLGNNDTFLHSNTLACLRKHNIAWRPQAVEGLLDIPKEKFLRAQRMRLQKAIFYGAPVSFKAKQLCCRNQHHDMLDVMLQSGHTFDDADGAMLAECVKYNALFCVEVLRRHGVTRYGEKHAAIVEHIASLPGFKDTAYQYVKEGFPKSWEWRFPF